MKLPRNIAGYVHESSLYSCHWNEKTTRGGEERKEKKRKRKGEEEKLIKIVGRKLFLVTRNFRPVMIRVA